MEAKTQFSATDIDIQPLTESDIDSLSNFYCGEAEIDNFFHNEVLLCMKYRYLSPYKCVLNKSGEIAGLFTLANDILNLEYEDKQDFPNLTEEYCDIFQRQTSYPAINIGHLAVDKKLQSRGIGRLIVEFVRVTFSVYKISGCQFITVDAINKLPTILFYESKMGFQFQTVSDMGKPTRRMYLDIFTDL